MREAVSNMSAKLLDYKIKKAFMKSNNSVNYERQKQSVSDISLNIRRENVF